MDEVDNIILLTLRQLGAELDDDITSLKLLTAESFVEGCARCLNAINRNEEMPHKLPTGMSARFRVGTTLAKACQALGYGSDIGYNNFLYGNENDCRNLLMWLVERLPKEVSETAVETLGADALLSRAISTTMSRYINAKWAPSFFNRDGLRWQASPKSFLLMSPRGVGCFTATSLCSPSNAGDVTVKVPKAVQAYHEGPLRLVSDQPPLRRALGASVLEGNAAGVAEAQEWEDEWNTLGVASGLSKEEYKRKKARKIRARLRDNLKTALVQAEAEAKKNADMMQFLGEFAGGDDRKRGAFLNKERLQFANEDEEGLPKAATEEELAQQREEELAALQAELDGFTTDLEALDAALRKLQSEMEKYEAEADKIGEVNGTRGETYKMRKKVLDLLPNADENIKKLQDVVDNSAKRLMVLADKWEGVRTGLISEYRQLRIAAQDKENDSRKQLDKIKALREDMKVIAKGAKDKERLYKQLEADYETMNKDITRSSYTTRILEIVRSIDKQKQQITATLIDTRALQKDTNQLEEKLKRTFTVTDKLIFADAKKDESVRQAYRYLAAMHESCNLLISTVEDTGAIMREARDLEDQIETESVKKMDENLKRIAKDYSAVKKENDGLIKQLKG